MSLGPELVFSLTPLGGILRAGAPIYDIESENLETPVSRLYRRGKIRCWGRSGLQPGHPSSEPIGLQALRYALLRDGWESIPQGL